MTEPTTIQTELFTTASEELQAEIEEELKKPDPDDKDNAIATLIKEVDENTK